MTTSSQPRTRGVAVLGLLLAFALSLFAVPQQTAQRPRARLKTQPAVAAIQPLKSRKPANSRLLKAYGNLPMRFEENRGQTDPRVQFLARGAGYSLFLTSSEAVLALHAPHHLSPGDLPGDDQYICG
jgi:hypothetical protein